MFPIRDHNPSGRTPYVTYALMGLNIAIFAMYWPLFSEPRALHQFYLNWAMVPALVTQDGAYYTLISYMFLHGGLLHLAGNMLFLWIFGDNLEDEMGHLKYLLFYVASGLGAALTHILMGPHSYVPTVGASGAIAGVMGGYLLLYPKARVDVFIFLIIIIRIIPIRAWAILCLWFGLQIFGGLGANTSAGGVAYWAHVGGFVTGLVLTVPLFLRLGGKQFWDRTHGRPPRPEAQYRYVKTSIPRVRRKR